MLSYLEYLLPVGMYVALFLPKDFRQVGAIFVRVQLQDSCIAGQERLRIKWPQARSLRSV